MGYYPPPPTTAPSTSGSHSATAHHPPPPTTAPSIKGSHSTQGHRSRQLDNCPSSSCDGYIYLSVRCLPISLQIINTEWGAFSNSLPLTEYDRDMDSASINLGEQVVGELASSDADGDDLETHLVDII
ncbi:hypothetical protein Taro_052565 [Colocasia esculenta]|uniref:hexokinase n=1 Tax=Colocasia esculenta TaxID=4460 RepID=A0A843XIT1_COLES|nr:hypothetical protein [Colocasia esculenta]